MNNVLKLSFLIGFLCFLNAFAVVAESDDLDEPTVEEQIVLDNGVALKKEMDKHFEYVNKSFDDEDKCNPEKCSWFGRGDCRRKAILAGYELSSTRRTHLRGISICSSFVCSDLAKEVMSWHKTRPDKARLNVARDKCVKSVLKNKKEIDEKFVIQCAALDLLDKDKAKKKEEINELPISIEAKKQLLEQLDCENLMEAFNISNPDASDSLRLKAFQRYYKEFLASADTEGLSSTKLLRGGYYKIATEEASSIEASLAEQKLVVE